MTSKRRPSRSQPRNGGADHRTGESSLYEIKKHRIIRDFWGVFSHLKEALRYDKVELGEAAFPLRRVREEFKLHMETTLSNSIPRFIALVLSRLSFDNIGSEALR